MKLEEDLKEIIIKLEAIQYSIEIDEFDDPDIRVAIQDSIENAMAETKIAIKIVRENEKGKRNI